MHTVKVPIDFDLDTWKFTPTFHKGIGATINGVEVEFGWYEKIQDANNHYIICVSSIGVYFTHKKIEWNLELYHD